MNFATAFSGGLGIIYLILLLNCGIQNTTSLLLKNCRKSLNLRKASKIGMVAGSYKVSVLGASGGIGQPLSLMLQQNPCIRHLSLYDVQTSVLGIAADLGHCACTPSISGYLGEDQLHQALEGSDIVIIPAGIPRKPGMTRDDLFNTNALISANLAAQCAANCPEAMILIISNPVNSLVPLFAEVLRHQGCYNPRKLFGVTTLDVVRANTFVSQLASSGENVHKFSKVQNNDVTVIGGHAGNTIIPLLSQVPSLSGEDIIRKLTHRIQFGGDEIVAAKDGQGSATLSMALAASKFTSSLLNAMSGASNVVECSFVQNELTSCPFFATKVMLGPDGVHSILPYGELSAFEEEGLRAAIPVLNEQIVKGINFGAKWSSKNI